MPSMRAERCINLAECGCPHQFCDNGVWMCDGGHECSGGHHRHCAERRWQNVRNLQSLR